MVTLSFDLIIRNSNKLIFILHIRDHLIKTSTSVINQKGTILRGNIKLNKVTILLYLPPQFFLVEVGRLHVMFIGYCKVCLIFIC